MHGIWGTVRLSASVEAYLVEAYSSTAWAQLAKPSEQLAWRSYDLYRPWWRNDLPIGGSSRHHIIMEPEDERNHVSVDDVMEDAVIDDVITPSTQASRLHKINSMVNWLQSKVNILKELSFGKLRTKVLLLVLYHLSWVRRCKNTLLTTCFGLGPIAVKQK